MHSNADICLIRALPAGRVLEFVAYQWPVPRGLGSDWPEAPGAIRFDPAQRPELLHFAPGRWLAPQPSSALATLLDGAVKAGVGTLVEVTGKWHPLVISGTGAARLLASAIDIGAVLKERGCAAATLFDCPVIVSGQGGEFALWVQSSYSADFVATARRLRAALWPAT